MNKTHLYDAHLKLSAKMVDFASWLMPLQYTGIIDEHFFVRNSAGIFDISHMGQIEVYDVNALQFLTTNDIFELQNYFGQYSFFCNENGGVIDDVIIYKFPEKFLVISNAVNALKVFEKIKNLDPKAKLLYDENFAIAVQGPKAIEISQKVFNDEEISNLKKRQVKLVFFGDYSGLLSRSGYTGEDGVEIFFTKDVAENMWDRFIEFGAKPCGLGSRDILRIEAGLPLYGHEIDEKTTPIEAGFDFAVKLNKTNFVGKNALKNQNENGTQKKLFGFEIIGRGIPRQNNILYDKGNEIGFITSGTFSPVKKAPIAMGYIYTKHLKDDLAPKIKIRDAFVDTLFVKLPFYRRPKI